MERALGTDVTTFKAGGFEASRTPLRECGRGPTTGLLGLSGWRPGMIGVLQYPGQSYITKNVYFCEACKHPTRYSCKQIACLESSEATSPKHKVFFMALIYTISFRSGKLL